MTKESTQQRIKKSLETSKMANGPDDEKVCTIFYNLLAALCYFKYILRRARMEMRILEIFYTTMRLEVICIIDTPRVHRTVDTNSCSFSQLHL